MSQGGNVIRHSEEEGMGAPVIEATLPRRSQGLYSRVGNTYWGNKPYSAAFFETCVAQPCIRIHYIAC
jgi:hypothetical protein